MYVFYIVELLLQSLLNVLHEIEVRVCSTTHHILRILS